MCRELTLNRKGDEKGGEERERGRIKYLKKKKKALDLLCLRSRGYYLVVASPEKRISSTEWN